MNDDDQQRPRLALRIRELLLRELGEGIDVGLMLGPPAYARAVVSLCRGSRSAELAALGEAFLAAMEVDRHARGISPSLHA
jgi:hypothetical protein